MTIYSTTVNSDVNKDLTLKAKARTKDLVLVLKESLRPGPRPRTNITDSNYL